jgi:hypothetical protein
MRKERYVGPRNDLLDRLVAAHGVAKGDWQARRKIVTALVRAGFPATVSSAGKILEALALAGVFRLRGVLVGTVAFQVYPSLLGKKMIGVNAQTADLDLAQFSSISVAIGEKIDIDLIDVLRSVDPTFVARPNIDRTNRATSYISGNFRVDVLVPNRGPNLSDPIMLPALRTHGIGLHYLDFLIYQEVKAVVLYGAGVPVNVPSPERFAFHKLLVSRLRTLHGESQAKSRKDLAQANALISALVEVRPHDLRDAWMELQERGPKWRKHLDEAVTMLSQSTRDALFMTIEQENLTSFKR